MSLESLMRNRRAAIARRWLDQTLQTYPADAAAFLGREKNQFANPVGHTLATGTSALVEALVAGHRTEELRAHLTPMLKIRSVQDFTPAQAVSFVFLLKRAVREELAGELRPAEDADELDAFDRRIDELCLLAFDVFTQSRERLHQIHVNDVKRRVSGVMRRLGITLDDPDQEPDVRLSSLRRRQKRNAEP